MFRRIAAGLGGITATGSMMAVTSGTAYAEPVKMDGPPGGWGPVLTCESHSNPKAENPDSSASGAWQFLDSTWAALGGTLFGARAKDATFAQQEQIADKAYAESGLSPWAASEGCWGGKIGKSAGGSASQMETAGSSSSRTTGRHRAVEPSATRPVQGGGYTVRAGDTLSAIAVEHHTTWQRLFAENRKVITNPSLIHVGLRITI
jgi:hypothetical protein